MTLRKTISAADKRMTITSHAYERARERLGWKPRTLDRMLERILGEGIAYKQTKGHLSNWISAKFGLRQATDVRLYRGYCFVFQKNRLITVYEIPAELKKYAVILGEPSHKRKSRDLSSLEA